jgi:hypothetical protein
VYDDGRLQAEVELLRMAFPDLEVAQEADRTWIRLPHYAVPAGWSDTHVDVAFQFPAEVGQPPYAFYVRPPLVLTNGAGPSNYTPTASTPWGADFGQFSWSPLEPWVPKTDVRAGANMLNFAMSFATRLAELS